MDVAFLGRERSSYRSRLREPAIRGAQLFAATGFALAQPLFDILGQNVAFFAVRGSSTTEIVGFALVVTLIPAAVMLGAELLVGLASAAAARVLHFVFLAFLFTVIALHVLAREDVLDGALALAVAAGIGIAGGLLVWRTRFASSFLTILAPAPLVFLALFLFGTPVLKLVTSEAAAAVDVDVRSKTPVVLVVFDEFPTVSLMDRSGRIDARRWPNFAALARDSTWFRNATTVHSHTEHAVPAILDGRIPDPDALPILADHPQNLFTFLRGSYRFEVIEGITHLCPRDTCRESSSSRSEETTVTQPEASLAHDVGVVYLHLVLPRRYASELPPIDTSWGNFGVQETSEDEATGTASAKGTVPACSRNICRLSSRITPTRSPTLYFVHSLLPHAPWLYLPSGKSYGGNVRVIPGTDRGTFGRDTWLPTQAEQRYLLQLGYTDAGLGLLIRRLKSTGTYDRALVIVTADHGVSFLPGQPRRNVTTGNLAALAFMPLFVKQPGQHRARVDDSFARTIDILPTIADVLDTRLPSPVDGRSLVAKPLPKDGLVSLGRTRGEPETAPLRELVAVRADALQRQLQVFGSGPLERVYEIGPRPELLGKPVTAFRVRRSTHARAELAERELLTAVDLSTAFLPSNVNGVLEGAGREQLDLAIAVDGTIQAITRTYTDLGETHFNAMVPERALQNGPNDVRVYAITGSPSSPVLEELPSEGVTYTLGKKRLEASDRTIVRVGTALSGEVRGEQRGANVILGGWAADIDARRPATTIVVLADGTSVFVGRNGNLRRDEIKDRYGVDKAGFLFRLPRSLVPDSGTAQVRVFALRGGTASELRYLPGYPWPTGG